MTSETHIALIEQDLVNMKADQVRMEKTLASLQSERDKALIWGVITLGAAVISMGAYIVNLFKGNLQ